MRQARERLEACLAKASEPSGEGQRVFIRLLSESAREAADAADQRARRGISLGPLDGTIVSIKDLFDMAGEPTTAGAKVLADAPAAIADSGAVARLRAGGAVLIGKTNLSEFAFHAMGTNPHFGTPGNAHDRARVPGGSSSGAAISLSDGMAEVALGSDTAGSIRVPAALNGLVGFKPTQKRVSLTGAFPLSFTLDSAGPLARSVAEVHAADSVLSGEPHHALHAQAVNGLRLLLPKGGFPLEGLEAHVASAFAGALARLAGAGARIIETPLPIFDAMTAVQARAGFSPIEALYIHRERIERDRADLDPVVASRIERGRGVSAIEYLGMIRDRADLVRAMDEVLAPYDALIMPTSPLVAPVITDVLSSLDVFMPKTLALIRNPIIANFFDLCSISLPAPTDGLPVGIMVTARHGHDKRLLAMAAGIEAVLAK